MSALSSSRRVNSWLHWKQWLQALPGKAGSTVVMTTVDHTLMRGSKPHAAARQGRRPGDRALPSGVLRPSDGGLRRRNVGKTSEVNGVVEHVLTSRKCAVAAGQQLELIIDQNGKEKRKLHIHPACAHIGDGAARPRICSSHADESPLDVQVC